MSSILILFNLAFANASTATLTLQGVVPHIIKQSVNPDNTITIRHNFPIALQDGCVIVSDTEMRCNNNITIITLE